MRALLRTATSLISTSRDGANDLPMLSVAGLGIAFHAKPKVKATAGQSLSTVGLDGILYFLGYKDSYIDDKQFKL